MVAFCVRPASSRRSTMRVWCARRVMPRWHCATRRSGQHEGSDVSVNHVARLIAAAAMHLLTFHMIGMIIGWPAWMLVERPSCAVDEVLMTPPEQHAAATAEVDVRAFA